MRRVSMVNSEPPPNSTATSNSSRMAAKFLDVDDIGSPCGGVDRLRRCCPVHPNLTTVATLQLARLSPRPLPLAADLDGPGRPSWHSIRNRMRHRHPNGHPDDRTASGWTRPDRRGI